MFISFSYSLMNHLKIRKKRKIFSNENAFDRRISSASGEIIDPLAPRQIREPIEQIDRQEEERKDQPARPVDFRHRVVPGHASVVPVSWISPMMRMPVLGRSFGFRVTRVGLELGLRAEVALARAVLGEVVHDRELDYRGEDESEREEDEEVEGGGVGHLREIGAGFQSEEGHRQDRRYACEKGYILVVIEFSYE